MGNQIFDSHSKNMSKEFITIQDAAELSRKSIQTIRRAIKAKKLTFRKQRSPQGFSYLINKKALAELYRLRLETQTPNDALPKNLKKKVMSAAKKDMSIDATDFQAFVKSMELILTKHNEERENFLRLVNTMQEKIFVLENQLNLLKSPPGKWYQFWK